LLFDSSQIRYNTLAKVSKDDFKNFCFWIQMVQLNNLIFINMNIRKYHEIHTCISVTFPRRPLPPSWSSHCQSTPRTTLAPGYIPRDVIFLLFRLGSTKTLFNCTQLSKLKSQVKMLNKDLHHSSNIWIPNIIPMLNLVLQFMIFLIKYAYMAYYNHCIIYSWE